uniref:YadA-like family protein n=4 Tax=Megamonas TaxID=158846 RepID=UPI0022E05065
NGTGTSSIKSTNATTEAYTKNDISYNGMTTTARGGKNPSESDNVNKTTSAVTYTGVTDTVYDDGGNLKTKSSVTTSGITNTVNDVSTGKALANSSLTTSGISNTTTDLVMTGTNEGKKMSTALYQNSNGISASATKKDENGTVGTSTLTLAGDSASLKVGNYGFTVDSNNNVLFSGKNASLTSTGLTVNGTGTSSIKSTNATTEAYTKNDISSAGMTTTARGGKYPSDNDNKNKTTSAVTYTGVTDTVYDDGGNLKTKSSVTTSGITNTVYDVNTGNALANSSLTTSGISNTTTDLAMTGTNEGKKMSTALYQNSNGISASATKKDENGTVGTSTLTLAGNSASLKVGNYGFAVDSNNNVSIAGNNATLSGSTFTLKDANGKTATLNTSGLTLKDEDGNTTGGISTTGAVTGTSLNITAKNTAGNKTTSTVGATGVTDRVYDTDGKTQVAYSSVGTGGISNTTSLKTTTGKIDTAINQNTSGVGINSTKYDTNNNVTDKTSLTMNGSANNITSIKYNDSNKTAETTSVSVNGGTSSITSYGNYVYGEDGKATSYNQASMSLNGNTGTATIRGGSNTASSTLTLNEAGVALSGKNASLSGSTFTLKDTTNGKTLASLGASGLSINNADGIKVGGISNTGNLIANDGMNVTDKNSSWVNIGTSTMQKDITATTTTSYAGITNKIDTTLDGNKTYTSGTVVGPTSVTTTVQGSTTTDAISGNKNKTTSTVSATGVTDTVYNVKGNQVASSSVTTNGIVNTTTNLSIDGSTNNTMSTSIYQDKRGISASATKKDENGTVGTSTLTLAGNSASLKVGNYGFAVDSNNNVSIAGNNATLSGSTFTLKDANGKTATLNTSGLTLKDEDGNTTGGISSTGAITGTSLRITTSEDTNGNKTVSTVATNGVTDTVTNNKTNNKTTSQVSANGVTDTVYGTDGTTKVASSSVSTSGISNTTSLKTTTGKIDTAINQNTSGVGISSTKYDTNNNVTDKTSVSVNGGTSSITSYGNYVYGEDGKATSYNQASMSLNGNTGIATIRGGSNTASSTLTLNEAGVGLSGKNVSLTSTDLTLKNVETGKAYVKIGSNGLNIYNDEGTSVFGVTRTGAINIDKNVTIDDSYTKDGYTYTASNSISGSNGISNVATKKDESGKTIATNRSTVTTSGITNSTNISGIAIKDDEYNTKTMSTSIAQNANGVSISSNKYNVYNDGTNTVQTTDGTSTISVNGAKTTISGYGYKYEKDENGKPILDEKGNPIRSSYTNASLSVDGESGIIGLSGKNVGLSANGLTLYKDVEGVKTQYASLTASGLNVNGTGYTIIKSTNATTGAMGQSQLSYNGVTDTVTNAAGNKTTSTVSATGTIDQVYDVDGKTRIAYSNVTTSGITDSFTKDGVTNSVTTNANGTTFASTGNGSTTIKGGAITTNSITVAGNTIDGGFFDTIGQTNGNTAGIVRTEINGDWITSIEGALDISRSGNISLNADKLTYSYNDGKNSGTLGALANKVDDIYDRTQGIDYDKATGTTTIDGNLSVKDETTTGSTGSTGETGTATNNGNITANTANIGGVQIGKNAVTATTGNFDNVAVGGTEGTSISKDGVTVGDKKSDNYTSITNNDVVVNNNGNKTSLTDVGNRVTGLESSVSSMNNRLSDVEDRIDKVGAMSAAIANLRTMGFDPEAPTEIAIGVGQYKSETGLALGVFHYPNQDFMLSASISTSGDEVMGGIGATWKLGRKSAAEKAKDEEARRLEKAEEMKKLAQDAKVKAQAERHAKLLAEREAQKTA